MDFFFLVPEILTEEYMRRAWCWGVKLMHISKERHYNDCIHKFSARFSTELCQGRCFITVAAIETLYEVFLFGFTGKGGSMQPARVANSFVNVSSRPRSCHLIRS